MTSIDTLIHTRSKLTRTELLRELADLSDTGGMVADQLNTAIHHAENLELLLRQAITQAMNDLTYARVALDEGRTVNELGILQRNGQNVDLYAAKLTEARIRVQAVVVLGIQILGIE